MFLRAKVAEEMQGMPSLHRAHMLKGIGYLISTVSVVLLAIVSWSSASQSALLMACLLGGGAASIVGMFCRWLSHEIEKRDENR
jgi:hypothetical protein